ncbi:MAG TPA: glycerophosphodiester phosphodiesterase [Acidimicrobiales bacterium]|nr:glycerophosphodiester phosphodiesterase [Acidimicrobiales bacterium]
MTGLEGGPAGPIGFAHRGARAERRENTLDAFARALELGATGLESDAWVTADGVVVLDHDGVTGPPWRHRAVSTQDRAELPEHIPALTELYGVCGTDFELSIDVKDPSALEPLLAVARRAGAAGRLWLCHHDWRVMAGWRRHAPEARLVESSNLAWMREGLAARSSTLAAAGLDALNLHGSQWDADRVREVRAAGLRAFAWDAQSDDELDRLLGLGVDGVYSDHADRMMAAIGRRRHS